jgi:hypothetical protein
VRRWGRILHHDSDRTVRVFRLVPDGPALLAAVVVHPRITAALFEQARALRAARRAWLDHRGSESGVREGRRQIAGLLYFKELRKFRKPMSFVTE